MYWHVSLNLSNMKPPIETMEDQPQPVFQKTTCGFCGKRKYYPCQSPDRARSCAQAMEATQHAYTTANTLFHPQRLEYSLAIMRYHQHRDRALLLLDINHIN